MTVSRSRQLAYLIQFFLGTAFGLYINSYLMDLGTVAAASLDAARGRGRLPDGDGIRRSWGSSRSFSASPWSTSSTSTREPSASCTRSGRSWRASASAAPFSC